MSVDARAIAERVAEVINRKVLGRMSEVESEVAEIKKELELWKETGVKSAVAAVMELKAKEIAREVATKLYSELLMRERSTDEIKEVGYMILEKLNALSQMKPSAPPELIKRIQGLSNQLSTLNDALNGFKTLVNQKFSDFEKRLSKTSETGDLKDTLENLSSGMTDLRKQIKAIARLLNEINERLDTFYEMLDFVHEVSGKLREEIEERKRARGGGEEE